MEVAATPPNPRAPGKRGPAKTKTPLAAAPRKPAVRKSKPIVEALPAEPDLKGLIAEAAYHLAASRGFAPGHEMQDWLQAEQQVLAKYR